MILSKATELKSGGWHYTVSGDKRTQPHACCVAHELTPHATKEEAERCKYEYDLSHTTKFIDTSARKCMECGEWTPEVVKVGVGVGHHVFLCADHQTPEMLRKHYPFESGIESYES